MCFNVRIGVEDVVNKVKETEVNVNELKTFSMLLSDTVIIGEATAPTRASRRPPATSW